MRGGGGEGGREAEKSRECRHRDEGSGKGKTLLPRFQELSHGISKSSESS